MPKSDCFFGESKLTPILIFLIKSLCRDFIGRNSFKLLGVRMERAVDMERVPMC